MKTLIIRTEDIKSEHILEMYVETSQDKELVELLKSPTPTILEGSRGTGKSFLLKVAEAQLHQEFTKQKILPVYVSFVKSSLLQTSEQNQFINWMMARLCSRVLRTLYNSGLILPKDRGVSLLAGGPTPAGFKETPLEKLSKKYEDSYKKPGAAIDSSEIPSVEEFKDAIEDICRDHQISRLAILFDEAAHIFRPEQQRQFFTLFRDLRSPYISCNAAVYPGVTFYGQTFQSSHDATILLLNRDILDSGYLDSMKDIVLRQADSQLGADIEKNRANFDALAYAVSGNPRLLLKTISLSNRLTSTDVKKVLKEFYRTEVWSEHSGLADRFAGHTAVIDWGRDFIENTVIPDSIKKNEIRSSEGKKEMTCFFWIHRNAPAAVSEALRLLSYTGIVTRLDTGIVATRSHTGTRYAVNLGCLAAPEAEPVPALTALGKRVSIKRFSEYGANHPAFNSLTGGFVDFEEFDISTVLEEELKKPIDVLDLTDYQKDGLRRWKIESVKDALQASEADFQRIIYIGPVRSRKMMNVVVSSVLEYLSG